MSGSLSKKFAVLQDKQTKATQNNRKGLETANKNNRNNQRQAVQKSNRAGQIQQKRDGAPVKLKPATGKAGVKGNKKG